MKAKMFSLVITMSLVILTFGAAPAQASSGKTDFTADWGFTLPGWVHEAGYPICSGHPEWQPIEEEGYPNCPTTLHDLANTYFQLSNSTDSRLNGIYVLRTTCMWPKGAFISGTCRGTWTADTDNDGRPEWEGVMSVDGNWSVTGHGLDEYAGLNVSFKVGGGYPDSYWVEGQVTGK